MHELGLKARKAAGVLALAPTQQKNAALQAMAKAMGAPQALAYKVPTADLETLRPQLPDETAFGVSYAEIDDFLEGKPVSDATFEIVLRTYHGTAHKRALAAKPAVHEQALSAEPASAKVTHG